MPDYLSFFRFSKTQNALRFLLLSLSLSVPLFLGLNRWRVELKVDGPEIRTVEYGEALKAENASASLYGSFFLRKGLPLKVRLRTVRSTSKLGTFTVIYSAGWLWFRTEEQREIIVQDTTPPTLTLLSSEDSYTLPGQTYQEEGYQAEDTCDGDLTDQVQFVQRGDTIYYTVQDSSGNEAHAERKIHYDDPVPPELTLAGEADCQISAGSDFDEPGWTAWDNCDGDLTDQVTITGEVDTFRAGVYPLRYTVSDRYGNTASRTRIVTVLPIPQKDEPEAGEKTVYLTFDDGPSRYTEQLLETLALYNVKAAFFTVNTRYAYLIAQEAEAGHTVGIHSATHDYSVIYASEDSYWADFWTQQEVIRELTGAPAALLRFPGGSGNTVSQNYSEGIMTQLTRAVTEQGYQYFDWNVSAEDADGTITAEDVFENVSQGIEAHDVSVVLQHDTAECSVEAVEKILSWGLSRGYTFLPLDADSPTVHQTLAN